MTVTTETVWMTPASRQRLQDELAGLEREPQNPETQARIVQLRELLRNAETDRKPDDGLVEPGMLVTVRFAGESEPTTFLLGHRDIVAVDDDVDVVSPTSPLGRAVSGRYVGDTVTFTGPTRRQEVAIVAAVPYP